MCVMEAVVVSQVDIQDQPQVSIVIVGDEEGHNCESTTTALHEDAEDDNTSGHTDTNNNLTMRAEQGVIPRTENQNDSKRQTFRCTRRTKCFLPSFVVMVLLVAVGLVLYFLLRSRQQDTEELPSSRFADQEMHSPGRWDTNGTRDGLELTVINALESHWHEYFDRAAKQWDSGSPDALNLVTRLSDDEIPETNCTGIVGAMKICNGYYADSRWRGVNKIIRDDRNFIVSSAARMNDYHLTGIRATDFPEMAYTMCHEMGHGFGVPHSDENFFNEDLKNCMDYTMNPGASAQPGTMNFQFLAQLYGTVIEQSDTYGTESIESTGEKGGERRKRGLQMRTDSGRTRHVPASVLTLFDNVDAIVDDLSSGTAGEGWRMLHESKHGEVHEIDAGEGYSIFIHMLKYVPSVT